MVAILRAEVVTLIDNRNSQELMDMLGLTETVARIAMEIECVGMSMS